MLRAFLKSPVRIAALLTLLPLLALTASELRQWHGAPYQLDFKVYLTAAHLVREHKSLDIYNEADTGQNPQTRYAPVGSKFQRAAAEIGIPAIWLYVYPPTLADLLVPFTFLSLRHACDAWLAVNILSIALAAMLAAWLVYDSAFTLAFVGIFAGELCLRSNLWGFGQGQICCVLVLLWTAGIVFYARGFKRTSAVIFGLATAIKLTPLLVLLPLLLWREWRWARWFAASLATLLLLMFLINGHQTLSDYVLHVMPPMSVGFPSLANISLPSGLTQLYVGLTGGNFLSDNTAVPRAVVLGTKLITSVVMLAVLFRIYRLGVVRSAMDRARILALVALLSLYCSPIAWRSAYGIAFLAAFFLWKDAFDRGISRFGLALLVFCTLEFSFSLDTLFVRFAHGVLLSTTPLLAPVSGCMLIFYALRQMQLSQDTSVTKESLPGYIGHAAN